MFSLRTLIKRLKGKSLHEDLKPQMERIEDDLKQLPGGTEHTKRTNYEDELAKEAANEESNGYGKKPENVKKRTPPCQCFAPGAVSFENPFFLNLIVSCSHFFQ